MTLTPDRRHDEQDKRGNAASPATGASGSESDCGTESFTYREMLRDVGFDLDGHPLAGRFDQVAAPPADDFEFPDAQHPFEPADPPAKAAETPVEQSEDNAADPTQTERWRGRSLWEASVDDPEVQAEIRRRTAELDAEKEAWMRTKAEGAETERACTREEFQVGLGSREEEEREAAERDRLAPEWEQLAAEGAQSEEHAPAGLVSDCASAREHPLLDEYAWSDLTRIAPEVADSIQGLRALVSELHSFTRPMGPDDAVTVMDGLETVNRLVESLSVVTLSVFERVGTPRDYGAKSTKALIQNRLNLSEREACRRSDLSKNLGNQVSLSGQSIGPVHPVVSEALQNGTLSSTQASTIIGCLKNLPNRIDHEDRLEAERILVDKAPTVRVKDIQELFNEILAWLDPDGELPDEAPNREDYSVSLRQRKDGTWALRGILDAVTGGIMSGHLTSRIKADDADDKESEKKTGSDAQRDKSDGAGGADDQEVVDVFSQVLRGDRSDAVDPSLDLSLDLEFGNGLGDPKSVHTTDEGDIPSGCGVREDGSIVAMAAQQPSVKTKIYERFATMIGRIEMKRVMAGSPFALVVTAKAEDVAKQSGRAATDAEAPFPMQTAAYEGLNGAVFFHLMGEKTKTMELATERRFATAKQLTILASRDQGCTFPACDTPPGWCDAHHIVPWADEGRTDINNLTLACGAHHRLIDKTDWFAVMLKDGRPAWIPPATIDPARRPILHSRFIAKEISDALFD